MCGCMNYDGVLIRVSLYVYIFRFVCACVYLDVATCA